MPIQRALGEIQVKSEICAPGVYETISPNASYTITGAAWSGESEVTGDRR